MTLARVTRIEVAHSREHASVEVAARRISEGWDPREVLIAHCVKRHNLSIKDVGRPKSTYWELKEEHEASHKR